MTVAELREAAWPDRRPRKPESIFMMLRRLELRLQEFGVTIARIDAGGEDRTYRLVPLPRTRILIGWRLGNVVSARRIVCPRASERPCT
jgi:hypothetical protein